MDAISKEDDDDVNARYSRCHEHDFDMGNSESQLDQILAEDIDGKQIDDVSIEIPEMNKKFFHTQDKPSSNLLDQSGFLKRALFSSGTYDFQAFKSKTQPQSVLSISQDQQSTSPQSECTEEQRSSPFGKRVPVHSYLWSS